MENLCQTHGAPALLTGYFTAMHPIKGLSAGDGMAPDFDDGRKGCGLRIMEFGGTGPLFVIPGDKIYAGMIVGEHAKGQDPEVNPLKAKQLTNIRASGKDDAVDLTPAQNGSR